MSICEELATAVYETDADTEAVHAALEKFWPYYDGDLVFFIGALMVANYIYVDKYGKITYAEAKRGKRRDPGTAIKSAAIKSYIFKKYKEVR